MTLLSPNYDISYRVGYYYFLRSFIIAYEMSQGLRRYLSNRKHREKSAGTNEIARASCSNEYPLFAAIKNNFSADNKLQATLPPVRQPLIYAIAGDTLAAPFQPTSVGIARVTNVPLLSRETRSSWNRSIFPSGVSRLHKDVREMGCARLSFAGRFGKLRLAESRRLLIPWPPARSTAVPHSGLPGDTEARWKESPGIDLSKRSTIEKSLLGVFRADTLINKIVT